MKTLSCVLCCSWLFLFSCSDGQIRPVDPDASLEAKRLLQFLYDIKGEYVLSGQHNFISVDTKYTELIKENAGRFPLIWGSDFSFCYEGDEPIRFQQYGPINLADPGTMAEFESLQSLDVVHTDLEPGEARERLVEDAIANYKKGFIITLMWHACPPGYGDSCDGENIWSGKDTLSESDWNDLITEGTRLNNAWIAQVDEIAVYLKRLQDAGVPVLWRPYHEMNGEWFWWGNRKGENGFRKLWTMMYDRYVHYHGLSNLIWVWNPNSPRDVVGDRAYDYEEFWPGSGLVDVLAVDISRDDWSQSYYEDIKKLADGKPIAVGISVPPPAVEIFASQSEWTWFMLWGNRVLWGNGIDRLQALFDSGRTLSLEDIAIVDDRYVVKKSIKGSETQ